MDGTPYWRMFDGRGLVLITYVFTWHETLGGMDIPFLLQQWPALAFMGDVCSMGYFKVPRRLLLIWLCHSVGLRLGKGADEGESWRILFRDALASTFSEQITLGTSPFTKGNGNVIFTSAICYIFILLILVDFLSGWGLLIVHSCRLKWRSLPMLVS